MTSRKLVAHAKEVSLPDTHTTAPDRPAKRSRLRRLIWKEETPLAAQFRLAWTLYFLLLALIVLLNRVSP